MTATLTSAAELVHRLNAREDITILDVRWRIDQTDGHTEFEHGHIPGAVYVDLESELTDHHVTGRGRHPLPSIDALTTSARRWGIRADVSVIIYDNWNNVPAARAWWLLTAAGIPNVSVLDGGWTAWLAARGDVETQFAAPALGNITLIPPDLTTGALPTITADQALEWASEKILLDARAEERYLGQIEPIDPVAGHIPGAVNIPAADVLTEDGRFTTPAELRTRLADAGIDGTAPVAVYCGSGINASQLILALHQVGIDAALFPGSWSEWTSNPQRPTASIPR